MPNARYTVLLLLLLGSCHTKLTRFHIGYSSEMARPQENNVLVALQVPEMKTNCRVRFERNDTKRSKVKRIYLKRLTFVSDAGNATSNALDLQDVFISSPDYPEQQISFSRSTASGAGEKVTFSLAGSEQDIQDFIKQDRFSMRFNLKKKKAMEAPANMRVEIDLLVEGELIKTNLFHKILV